MEPRYILPASELPKDFVFPRQFLDVLSAPELLDIRPWWWLTVKPANWQFWNTTLREQFPSRILVPFAKMWDTDDVACFDGTDRSGNPRVLYIHAYTTTGWEYHGEETSFTEWLRRAEEYSAEMKKSAGEEVDD